MKDALVVIEDLVQVDVAALPCLEARLAAEPGAVKDLGAGGARSEAAADGVVEACRRLPAAVAGMRTLNPGLDEACLVEVLQGTPEKVLVAFQSELLSGTGPSQGSKVVAREVESCRQ